MCLDAGDVFFQNFKPFGVSDSLGERIPVFSVGRFLLQVTGHRSQVTGHRLQVTGHKRILVLAHERLPYGPVK